MEQIYRRFFVREIPIVRMNIVSAEITKVALNTFVTTKITFANVVAQLCERMPGADADAVTAAIGRDSRIGPKYLKGALSYGGPCFPRDVAALDGLARQLGVDPALPEALDKINRQRQRDLLTLVQERLRDARRRGVPMPRAGVLGFAFKPDSDVTVCSPGLMLAESLVRIGESVTVHDPWAVAPAIDGLHQVERAEDCIRDSAVIVVATPWTQYKSLPPSVFRGRAVIDCWRALDGAKLAAVADYVPLGVGLPADSETSVRRRAA
jgi:UDPglucose 6-dehydrogenase